MSLGRYDFDRSCPPGFACFPAPAARSAVTANDDIDRAIALSRIPGVTITTFGDMVRVPGSTSSLDAREGGRQGHSRGLLPARCDRARQPRTPARGCLPRRWIRNHDPRDRRVILEACARGIDNFSVLSMHKTTSPALRAIRQRPRDRHRRLHLAGHVSTITGLAPFRFLAEEYGIPGVVTGFEPVDILEGIALLIDMIERGAPAIETPTDEAPATRATRRPGKSPSACSSHAMPPGAPGRAARVGHAHPCAVQPLRRTRALRGRDRARAGPRGCRCGDVLRGTIAPSSNRYTYRYRMHARASRGSVHGVERGQLRGVSYVSYLTTHTPYPEHAPYPGAPAATRPRPIVAT